MDTQRDADVVVVGAGTGGLTVAAYLAVAGRRVVVVDRGRIPGGFGSVFSRGGYEFDVGLHFLGSSRDGVVATQQFLDPLGIDVPCNRIDPVDAILLPDGCRFEVPTGLDAYRDHLHAALSDEGGAVDRYLDLVAGVDAAATTLGHAHSVTDVPVALWRSSVLLRHLRTTLGEVFDDLSLSPRARTLLGWLSFVYTVPPSEVSLLMHAIVTMQYLNGAWYPRGGGAVISDRLAQVVRQHGGEFVTEHEVTHIAVRSGRATGIEARGADGTTMFVNAPTVVSDVDVKRTFLDLLDPDVVPLRLRKKVRGYEMALPLSVLYAVADSDLTDELRSANLLVVPHDDPEQAYRTIRRGEIPDDPIVWLTSASRKDPGNTALCKPGQTNLQLLTPVPAAPHVWGLELGVARGDTYEDTKQRVRDRVLAVAERAVPGLRDALVYEDLATPYTMGRYMGVTDGTSYGIAATPDQMLLGRPGPKTPIPGLFLVGASARDGHGITGVMSGGVSAASAILGESAVKAARGAHRLATPA